jgi:hypothetical protein
MVFAVLAYLRKGEARTALMVSRVEEQSRDRARQAEEAHAGLV